MSVIKNIEIIAMSLLVFLSIGCSHSDVDSVTDAADDEVAVLLNLDGQQASRSFVDGKGTLKQLRVLVFAKKGDDWEYEKMKTYSDFENRSEISVKPGTKRFYFFGNDDKAKLYSASTGSRFTFSDDVKYTEAQIKDIVIDRFVYDNPAYDENDLLPMTGFIEEPISENVQVVSCELTRAVTKVTINMKLKSALGATESLKLVYVSIGNNPTQQYYFPQLNEKGQVKLPSYTDISYAHSTTFTPASKLELTTAEQKICSFYLHENPYGKAANGTTIEGEVDHLAANGYTGTASRINLFYEYYSGTETIQKGVLADMPYMIRNNNLTINVTVTPPEDTETFEINVKVVSNWVNKTEDVPTFE